MTTTIEVGKPYPHPELVKGHPSAGWHHVGGSMILVADAGMTPARAATEWDGCRLWLLGTGPLLVLVAKLANGDELEMPGARLMDQPMPRWAVEHSAADRLAFQLITVDSDTGVVAGIKLATASPHFTAAMSREARDRWQTPITAQEYAAAVQEHQRRYPTIKSILRDATASTKLGD